MSDEEALQICQKAARLGYKPYFIAVVDGHEMEFISYPFVTKCGKICIKVREFDDSTSIRDAMIPIDLVMDLEL